MTRDGEPISVLEFDLQEHDKDLAAALKQGTSEAREAALRSVRQAARECGRRWNATYVLVTDGDRWICLVDRRNDTGYTDTPGSN